MFLKVANEISLRFPVSRGKFPFLFLFICLVLLEGGNPQSPNFNAASSEEFCDFDPAVESNELFLALNLNKVPGTEEAKELRKRVTRPKKLNSTVSGATHLLKPIANAIKAARSDSSLGAVEIRGNAVDSAV